MKRKSLADEALNVDTKRSRIKHRGLRHAQAGSAFLSQCPQDTRLVGDQLLRALMIVLRAAGFDSARSDAAESLRAMAEEYMLHFSLRVQQSMQASRRTRPVPQDFVHALASFGLTPSAFTTDLQMSLRTQAVQPPLQHTMTASRNSLDNDGLFDSRILTASTERRAWVPKSFPSFPGRHAFRETPVYTERETDAQAVREKATQEGMLAEQALRKLMAARRASSRVSTSSSGDKLHPRSGSNEHSRRREEAWKEVMKGAIGDSSTRAVLRGHINISDPDMSLDEAGDRPDDSLETFAGIVVNYNRAFERANVHML